MQEKLNQANAQLNSAKSDLNYARQNYSRVRKLHNAKAATDVALEDAVNRLAQAETAVENATANLNQAQVNLSYAYIYSPIDGVILERAVNTGQTVAASFNTPTLFTIAEDLTKMQVEADVDEADIGQVRIGQKVNFTVDAYVDDIFEGTVSQIRIQPKVTSNVVTYTVIVNAPNPEEKLFPGMTANITIEIQAEEGNLVPVEAINFKMSTELMAKLGIDESTVNANNKSKQYVWVNKDGVVEQRGLKTGLNDGINYIVYSGVQEGEEVVLSASIGKKKNSVKMAETIMSN
ncbi:MAG: efflux RND transporter periplasmic adaptor subunit [Bacteroides sp.]|nr:efflux RND transporter periplasmic adaptor subunit [Bacteroides sp.]